MSPKSRIAPPGQAGQAGQAEPTRPTLEAIYREQGTFVGQVLERMGVAPRHLEDAMHDVFLVVHRRLSEYEPRDKLRAWLAAIAVNVAKKYREKQLRERAEHQPLESEHDMAQADPAPSSETTLVAHEMLLVLLASIREPEAQLVFTLHQLVGLPVPEIAGILKIPVGTASSRLRRAREDIADAMKRLQAEERRREGAVVVPLFGALPMEAPDTIPPLPEGVFDRVWARLRHLPDGDGGSSGDPEGTVEQGAKTLARRVGPLVGAVGLGLGLGVLWNPLRRLPEPVEARPDSMVMATPSATPIVPAASPWPPSSATPSSPVPAAPRSGAVSLPESDLAAERASMVKASRALAGGDTTEALAIVQAHARGGGDGRLAEEWDALRISALLRAGQFGEARERLDRFARRYPTSGRLDGFREALPSTP